MTDDDWQIYAAAMADQLSAAAELTDPHWRDAFTAVPRHLFVPGHSLADAYGTDAIVTQTRPAPVNGGSAIELPTSSASAPGVVAIMLDRLDIRTGQRVLEIGTGTGYNAALLCHRLGDKNIASIDIDPDLISEARERLAQLNYHPTLAAGDGYQGLDAGAPYDAILATCAIDHIPPAWIHQLHPGGRIVAPLTSDADSALMILAKTADDEVTGRFDPTARVSFMPLREHIDHPLAHGGSLGTATQAMANYGTTDINPHLLADQDDDLVLFLHLHIPGLVIGTSEYPTLGETITVHDHTATADAALTPTEADRWTVTQRGPRRLWDTIEHAVRLWRLLAHPDRSHYGITALDRTDRQYVWLDDPDGPYSWPMPL